MSDLTPTPRVDKNGRVVVRHMKADSDSGTRPKKSLPVPAVVPQQDTTDLVENASAAIEVLTATAREAMRVEVDFSTTEETLIIKDKLPLLNEEEHETIIEWAGNENASRLWILHEHLLRDDNILFAKDFLHLCDFLEEQEIEEVIFSDYVRGFQQYKNLHPIAEDGSYPETRLEQCKVLTRVLLTMVDMVDGGHLREEDVRADSEPWTPFIRDERLQNLLLKEDTDVPAVMKVITERRIIDADHIQAILTRDVKALGDGIL